MANFAHAKIGTLDKLCTVLMTQMNQWLTRNILVIFIRFNPWINTQNNKLSQSCMNNIEHCDVSTRMQHLKKKIDDRYATIQWWWYSIEAFAKVELVVLENWFSFWHFFVK